MTLEKKKVFGIGLSKTGTTSLAKALEILGFKTKDYLGVTRYTKGDLSSIDLEQIENSDAFTDTPIPSFYQELDKRYPRSKFILTVRDMDDWLSSCKKQFTAKLAEKEGEASRQVLIDLYGSDVFDATKFKAGFERFVQGVLDYFKGREGDLLVIDVCGGEGWAKLCPFLGVSVPDVPFPQRNVTSIQWMNVERVVEVARDAGRAICKAYDGVCGLSDRNSQTEAIARSSGGKRISARSLYARALQAAFNDDSAVVRSASRASLKTVIRGLSRLNPAIPVVSPQSSDVSNGTRMGWNHFWLIDPLDGEASFLSRSGGFTVNIALIESGEPILGVVYAPATDTCYYAKGGHGSYKRHGKADPERLMRTFSAGETGNRGACGGRGSPTEHAPEVGEGSAIAVSVPTAGTALRLCVCAETSSGEHAEDGPVMDWEAAAAHAVLRFAGMTLRDAQTGEEVRYNKNGLANGPLTVERRRA